MTEKDIQSRIRKRLNATRLCRIIRNNVGKGFLARFPGDPAPRFTAFGLGEGSPDLVGVLRSGVCFCIEVKAPKGRAREAQLAWWRAARLWGIRGGFARSETEALRLLHDALPESDRHLLLQQAT